METNQEILELTKQIEALKEKLSEARRRRQPEPFGDYDLLDQDGSTVKLSELFGDKHDLIVIHNMGRGCAYCTMWADGFVSALPHLEDRAAFVVVTPDEPEVQKAFAESRGWTFRMTSGAGGSFIRDAGFEEDDNGRRSYWPGLSAFRRNEDGSIVRTGTDVFGPGDDYCPPWRMFDLLHGGAGDWEPKYEYS
jgi:predicted dithiol-disulfide oxidoreductase (DUF899 family)